MAARLFIGMMSGTSCDGVDAALVRIDGEGASMVPHFIEQAFFPYDEADQLMFKAPRTHMQEIKAFAAINHRVARNYVACVEKLLAATGMRAREITAIAAHGQTLFHAPPLTWQAFDPAYLAVKTGIDVVSDFRRADLAAGGQGAPLVPFGDHFLFRTNHTRVVLNIGGIANITVLPGEGGLENVRGYDVGPGNCLSDWVMRDHGGFDNNGEMAFRGKVLDDVAAAVLDDEFFERQGPKSTDTPYMINLFEHALKFRPDATLPDKLATANHITATAILREIAKLPSPVVDLFVAGGGVKNRNIVERLQAGHCVIRTTDELGIPAQAREAVAFAILAAAHVDRFSAYMPLVTGAKQNVVLGSYTPGHIGRD